MAYLALVRHGESEWNALDLWTGWVDKSLTEKGRQQAKEAAKKLRNIKWDFIFESDLQRVKQTTEIIVKQLDLHISIVETSTLRERNYGVYTGRNKLDVRKEIGDREYEQLHRGWNYPIENGESLKQVYERVIPYYQKEIAPRIERGLNIIVSASGNSLRALAKYLKKLSDKDIEKFEIKTGEVIIMTFPAP